MNGTNKVYRNTTLGKALTAGVMELVGEGVLVKGHALKVLDYFDNAMARQLALRENTCEIKMSGKLKLYRNVNGVWTMVLGPETKLALPNSDYIVHVGAPIKIIAKNEK
jgi:hypothetical protein